ncbi:hypothetical protein RGQ29_019954 [Quercus rubra]|uniref:Uncharacterized protein n=1 Tax=Quercus rubra TaxID=3512 RepID=A0AAN7ITQ1_QUERU|nr:hypothetical protein RGQ29_019954 [Quercus rubra]
MVTAKSLGLPHLNAYLDSLGTNFTHGANFATYASTIGLPTSITPAGTFSPFYLYVQYSQFLQFRSHLLRQKGKAGQWEEIYANLMPKGDYFSKALYTFDIGQDDLAKGFFFGNMTIEEVNASIPDIVNKFSINVKNIYNLGARSFWIHNTGPIGCLLLILANFPSAQRDSYAQYFNHKLKEAMVQLMKDLPLAAFTYVNVYSFNGPGRENFLSGFLSSPFSFSNQTVENNIFHQIFLSLFSILPVFTSTKHTLSKSKEYGFEIPLVACCNGNNVGCGGTIIVNGSRIFVGSSANKFVFDQISTGAFSDPPIPLKMACHDI